MHTKEYIRGQELKKKKKNVYGRKSEGNELRIIAYWLLQEETQKTQERARERWIMIPHEHKIKRKN